MTNHKSYQFTLVLKNVSEKTVDLEDSLYEAGCDDALINYRNGAVYLEFDREANSLEDAVISAIKDVRSATVDADVVSIAPENIVTESEIAKRLNVKRQTVSLWIKGERREGFPPPVMRLSEKSPLWHWNDVVIWLFENKMLDDQKILDSALFFANINAALGELDKKARDMRHHLVERITY
jgi:hypothetical protein